MFHLLEMEQIHGRTRGFFDLRQGDEERLEMEDSQAGGLRNNESWNVVTDITQKTNASDEKWWFRIEILEKKNERKATHYSSDSRDC